MMRALAPLLLCVALAPAIAAEPALKPPPAAAAPTPAQPAPEATPERPFVLIHAGLFDQIRALIAAQQREIERLRAITEKGSCS